MAVGVAVLLAGIISAVVYFTAQPTELEAAAEDCGGTAVYDELEARAGIEEGDESAISQETKDSFAPYLEGVVTAQDNGTALIVATKPATEDPAGLSNLALACVQQVLDMPVWLLESINSTRALDGRQADEWDSYKAQWSYHPDDGLNLIIVQK